MKKLNKKGFTLVELIAVIAILSILMILALPQILELFQEGKESAFITQAQSIYKSAEDNYISAQISPDATSTTITFCHSASKDGRLLTLSGSENVYYEIKFSGGKMTSFKVNDGSYGYENTNNPKISDIKTTNLIDQGTADKITITCE